MKHSDVIASAQTQNILGFVFGRTTQYHIPQKVRAVQILAMYSNYMEK